MRGRGPIPVLHFFAMESADRGLADARWLRSGGQRRGEGQVHGDVRAFAELAGERNLSSAGIDDGLADGEPQAGAAGGPGTRSVSAPEALEQVREIFGRNAIASVVNFDGNSGTGGNSRRDRAARRRVLHGV